MVDLVAGVSDPSVGFEIGQDAEALVEGNVYEVVIGDVGRKGDGVAKIGKYTIYVPRTTKGNIVKIKISKISGTIAFAEPVVE